LRGLAISDGRTFTLSGIELIELVYHRAAAATADDDAAASNRA